MDVARRLKTATLGLFGNGLATFESIRRARASPASEVKCINVGSDRPSASDGSNPLPRSAIETAAKTVAVGTAVGVGSAAVATPAAVAAAHAVGFGTAGVTGGSIAAGLQVPLTMAGGWFATFQSVGATAMLATSTVVGVGLVVGAAAAGGYVLWSRRGGSVPATPAAPVPIVHPVPPDDSAAAAERTRIPSRM